MRQLRRALAWPSGLRSRTPWVLLTAAVLVGGAVLLLVGAVRAGRRAPARR